MVLKILLLGLFTIVIARVRVNLEYDFKKINGSFYFKYILKIIVTSKITLNRLDWLVILLSGWMYKVHYLPDKENSIKENTYGNKKRFWEIQ